MTWADRILDFHFGLQPSGHLPEDVEWLYPYEDAETRRCMEVFYRRYYDDRNPRLMILGINPGRFGAGVTGVPFTDPIRLDSECGIENAFHKRPELSSVFVYDIVHAFGGPRKFFGQFYITSVCPLGFLKDGKNFNYYDSAALAEHVRPLIIDNLRSQCAFGAKKDIVYCMGQGTNFKYLDKWNAGLGIFDKIVALPHPRWVMQYRRKRKEEFLAGYVAALTSGLD